MKFLRLTSLILLLLSFSCEKEMSELSYIRLHRQKVASAMAAGLSDEYPTEIGESIDFCLDKAGNVRFKGTLETEALLQKASVLDGTMPREQYRALLEDMSGCIHLGMYYDGNLEQPAAVFTLGEIRLKDCFGTFSAYTLLFRFRNSCEIGVREFFESTEFYPYKKELMDYIKKLMDVLLAS